MDYIIRFMNWGNKNEKGIPRDAEDVMRYFNYALDKGGYPYVPRKTRITEEEIIKLWLAGKDTNISIVAEFDGEIVGSGTALFDPKSNIYSLESERSLGEYAITVNPTSQNRGIGTEITKRIIEECRSRGLEFISHTSIDNNQAIRMMEKLGFKPKKIIEYYERYANAGLNPKVFLYKLP